MKHTYYAKRIVQWTDALPFYVIGVTPSDLLQWASVPRKAPEAMEGYQRPLTDRWKKIKDFMESHRSNVIPGSVIVASEPRGPDFFDVDPVEIEGIDVAEHELFRISFEYSQKSHVEMLDDIIKSLLDNRQWTEEEITAMNAVAEPDDNSDNDIRPCSPYP